MRLVHWKHYEAHRDLVQIVQETKECANLLRAIIRGSFAFCATDRRVPSLMYQTHFGPVIPGISELMAEIANLRFAIIHQAMQAGLDAGEQNGGDAGVLTLAFLLEPKVGHLKSDHA